MRISGADGDGAELLPAAHALQADDGPGWEFAGRADGTPVPKHDVAAIVGRRDDPNRIAGEDGKLFFGSVFAGGAQVAEDITPYPADSAICIEGVLSIVASQVQYALPVAEDRLIGLFLPNDGSGAEDSEEAAENRADHTINRPDETPKQVQQTCQQPVQIGNEVDHQSQGENEQTESREEEQPKEPEGQSHSRAWGTDEEHQTAYQVGLHVMECIEGYSGIDAEQEEPGNKAVRRTPGEHGALTSVYAEGCYQ